MRLRGGSIPRYLWLVPIAAAALIAAHYWPQPEEFRDCADARFKGWVGDLSAKIVPVLVDEELVNLAHKAPDIEFDSAGNFFIGQPGDDEFADILVYNTVVYRACPDLRP